MSKILLYDLETSPNLGYTWGKYEQNVLGFKKEWEILSFAYKWLDEKKVNVVARPDFKDRTDRSLVKSLWKILDSADITVAHNGNEFDNKKSAARFITHGLVPPSPSKSVDTCKVARQYFKFNSNSLDDLGQTLGLGRKIKTGGFDLWLGCLNDNSASWNLMKKYNKQDVLLLEKVYLKLLPWINTHPNVSQLGGRPDGCPKCGGARLKSHGIRRLKTTAYTQYICLSCGGYCRSRTPNQQIMKPKVVNL